MHSHSVDPWRHEHVFLGAEHARNERRTWIVIALTAAIMGGGILAGVMFGSMALLADGFHMATHAGALTIAAVAYLYARDARFTFGTGKLGELAGYSSAVVLAGIALLIGFGSVVRLAAPVPIRFDEAIAVAALGLLVNLASAWVLHDGEHHAHDNHQAHASHDDHAHGHAHDDRDHNLRSAYFHVLTDTLTPCWRLPGCSPGASTVGSGWTR